MKQRSVVFLCVALVAVLGFFVLHNVATRLHPIEPLATTTQVSHCDNDAKLCPDGSTVLRTGEQCEFAACPSAFGDQKNWRTGTDPNSAVTFTYPETLDTNYVRFTQWPPHFAISNEAFSCEQASSTSGTSTTAEHVGGIDYCLKTQKEGAAGSTYSTYQVSFLKEEKLVTMDFVIQTVQCLNYDGTEQSACLATQESFKVIELVDAVARTLKM